MPFKPCCTRVKHELLDKYLTPWIYKLGSANNALLYIDGFAGRGEYFDGGQLSGIGSPVIAMRKAQEHKEKVSKFLCLFIEKNKDNFENLCSIIEKEKSSCSHPIIRCANGDFETEIIKLLDEKHDKLPPTFCFIDPFGFDAPFYVIKRLMAIPKTEVFFTFMSRDINRFISSDKHINSLNKLFGTEKWKEHIQNSSNNYLNEKSILQFLSLAV